jgi:hypothetical protein
MYATSPSYPEQKNCSSTFSSSNAMSRFISSNLTRNNTKRELLTRHQTEEEKIRRGGSVPLDKALNGRIARPGLIHNP